MHLLPLGRERSVAAARKSWHDTIGLWILHSCSVVFLHSCLCLFLLNLMFNYDLHL